MLTSLSFSIISSALSSVLRLELTTLSSSMMDSHSFNVVVTSHSIIMIFFFVMPMLISGFSNWLMPFMMSTADMAWPRLNNFSFWMLMPASICLVWSLLMSSISSSWTIYPPLSALEAPMDAMIFSLHLASISSILGAINFITTMLLNGPKSFTVYNLYLYLWAMMVTVFMLLTTLPVLAASITMLLFDRHFNTSFFNVTSSSDPILFQHLFWFFSHPEVYVLILPSFSMLSHVMAYHSSMEQNFSYYSMVWSILSISLLSFIVWAHHMFSISMDTDSKAYFASATIIMSVPTSVKVFSWLAHLCTANVEFTLTLAWALMFIWLFTISSVTSIVLSSAAVDLLLHDTYYVVAHFHYVLSMSAVSSLMMSWHFWVSVFSSVSVSELYSWLFLSSFFISVNLTFLPMHLLSLDSFPRRYCSFSDSMLNYNRICSISALMSIFFLFVSLSSYNPAKINLMNFSYDTMMADASFFFSQQSKAHTHMETPLMQY